MNKLLLVAIILVAYLLLCFIVSKVFRKGFKKSFLAYIPFVNIICLLIGFFCPALSIIFLFFFGIRYIRYIKPIGYGIFIRFIVIVISAVLANI